MAPLVAAGLKASAIEQSAARKSLITASRYGRDINEVKPAYFSWTRPLGVSRSSIGAQDQAVRDNQRSDRPPYVNVRIRSGREC